MASSRMKRSEPMTGTDTARNDTLTRLAASRADIRRLLEPPPRVSPDSPDDAGSAAVFPRSRTMKMLLSDRGAGPVQAVPCGLFLARPHMALRLLRILPAR